MEKTFLASRRARRLASARARQARRQDKPPPGHANPAAAAIAVLLALAVVAAGVLQAIRALPPGASISATQP